MNDSSLRRARWRDPDPTRCVGWLPAGRVTLADFQRRIGAWQACLDTLAAPGRCYALHERDPLAFASALLALWERGDSALLPADDRPETLAGVDALTQARLGGVPGGHRPGDAGAAPRWGTLSAERTAVWLYTSGSTGAAQRLPKSFAQLDAELATHRDLWPLEGRLTISQVSHQHIYGLLFAILRPLVEAAPMAGALCRYPETLHAWLAALDETSQAVLISAPPPLERLPETLDWPRVRQRLAAVYSSGAPLPAAAGRRTHRLLDAPVRELYGSSETGGIAWRGVPRQDDAWTPLPGIAVRADRDDDHLWLRSPYLDSRDWQRQADRIREAGDGRFQLLGRADRIAKVGGKRLSLTAMDRALEAADGVRRARTVVLPEPSGRLGAIVQLDPAGIPVEHGARRRRITALRERLARAFEPTVIPRAWRFVETWPVNAQGKLTVERVERLFRDRLDHRQPRWLGVEAYADGCCHVTLEVPERLAHLAGHFPGRPVVPGVVMIQWTCDLAREHLGVTGAFSRLERVKFPQLLPPGERVTLALEWHGDMQRLDFRLSGRHGCHASGRMHFRAGDPS